MEHKNLLPILYKILRNEEQKSYNNDNDNSIIVFDN